VCFLAGLVLFAAASTSGSRAEALFEQGLRAFEEAVAYRKEHPADRAEVVRRFKRAAELFVEAWKAGAVSTNVFTNAGNSFYFAGDTGEAVLFWRRALAVDPGNERAWEGLQTVRRNLPFRRRSWSSENLASVLFMWGDPRSFLWRYRIFLVLFPAAWLFFTVELARKRWRWVKIFLIPVLPLALVAAALGYLFRLARPYAVMGGFCLIPAVILLGSLLFEAHSNERNQEAVILVEVQGRRGDGPLYSPSHSRPFPPGTEVKILEEHKTREGSWLHVALPDGSKSWVPAETVERVLVDPPEDHA